jgi:signal peptide peptidase SppA
MSNEPNKPVVPYADQYVGVWSILESHANALLQQAQQINIQLHLEANKSPEKQAAIAAQASTDLSVTREGVAVIELSGSLTKHASSFSSSRSTVAARRQVRAAANDDSIIGILLHIDSPGGMVAGTVDLADEIAVAKKKKPVYAYIEDLGASAAYWIASQADKVFANRSAEVGSIGVFMVVTDWSAYAEKEGAKVHVVKFGQFKGAGMPGTEVTDEQLAEWQKSVDGFGDMFVDAIAAGRGLSKTQVKQLADGRVHGSSAAADLKLIDGVQTLDATLAALVVAGTPNKQKGKTMSNTQASDAPERVPATAAQLKAEFPDSNAEFRVEQLEKGATLAEAHKAYSAFLSAENARLKADKEAADKATAEAAAKAAQSSGTAPKSQVRGNKAPASAGSTTAAGDDGSDNGGTPDYHAEALAYQKEHKCRYSEACHAIKRRHPEALAAFGGPKL